MKTIDLHKKLLISYSEIGDGIIDTKFVDEKTAKNNRKQILKSIGLGSTDFIEAAQIHSDRVLALNEENTKMWRGKVVTGVDGFVTGELDAALIIRVADCVPLVLYDPTHHVVGLFHVGWRGAVKDVHVKGLESLVKNFETDPRDVLAWLGPCAQSCCYQSKDKPQQAEETDWKKFIKKEKSVWHVNVPGYVMESLKQVGMLKKNMTVSKVCTIESDNLFSKFGSVDESKPNGTFVVLTKLK